MVLLRNKSRSECWVRWRASRGTKGGVSGVLEWWLWRAAMGEG